MKPASLSSILIKLSTLVIIVTLLTACGSSGEDYPDEVISQEDTSVETTLENSQTEMNSTGVKIEEEELPSDFPEENSYRIFFAFPEVTLEEVLTYYHHELQVLGWAVETEGDTALGYKMDITHTGFHQG